MLGPLQDNGGPTPTHALLAGSPAIDAVLDCTDFAGNPVITDQRGSPRFIDGNGDGTSLCDIGSFEAAACTGGDTLPPQISCPSNVTAVSAITCPPAISAVVNFPTPTATDNCPADVAVVCNPPSGSTFPVGTSTVTCTATDAAGQTTTCTFTVTLFNACLQDDTNPGNVILFNTQTGEYRACCGGVVIAAGVGTVYRQGCDVTLQHYAATWRVTAKWGSMYNKGGAAVQSLPGTVSCTITDRDTRNNTCQCVPLTDSASQR